MTKEMREHKRLTEMTGVSMFFADPHSPRQRGSNENTNGLLREYLPKGTPESVFPTPPVRHNTLIQ